MADELNNSADKMLNLIRSLIDQEMEKRDTTVICKIASKNEDGTYNVYVEPDETNIIHNIPALSTNTNLQIGDYVNVYKIRNQMNNSFILKATAGFSDVTGKK